ncbi:MAG: hypothetical protein F6K11_20710 [Leptolyngbya sp. SIO3F4]|nr:hypothetical protein [Leptolyngbya sp. SIO3F4]
MAMAFLQDLAVVTQTIYPHQTGRIRLHNVLWFARADHYIPAGTEQSPNQVAIIGRQGNTLIVQPTHFSFSGKLLEN